MGVECKYQEIINKLYSEYKQNGFVTEDAVFKQVIKFDLPFDEIDYVCEQLLGLGIIISNSVLDVDDEDDIQDRSHIDYEVVYQEVIRIDESLKTFIDEVRKIKPPHNLEWKAMFVQTKNDNLFAKTRLIEMYIKIVIKIALSFSKKYNLPLVEAIQDGCVGLIIAVEKYELDKQASFPVYATWWIRQNISRESSLNPSVYIPVHMKDKLLSLHDKILNSGLSDELWKESISMDDLNELVLFLEVDINDLQEYYRLTESYKSIEETLEIDEAIYSDNGIEEQRIAEINSRNELNFFIRDSLNSLDEKERNIICLRYGLYDGREQTLEEIGTKYRLTRERIRQIEKKTLKKLEIKLHLKNIWSINDTYD